MYNDLVPLDDEDVFVIDSNDRIEARMEQYQLELVQKEERKKKALEEQVQSFYDNLEYDEDGEPILPMDEEGYVLVPMDEDGNPLVSFDENGKLIIPDSNGLESFDSDEFMDDPDGQLGDGLPEDSQNEGYPQQNEDAQAMIQEMMDQANAEAERIISDANEQAAAILENAHNEGMQQGYDEGMAQAMESCQEKERELDSQMALMNQEYQEKMEAMEGELVSVISEVIAKAFKVDFSNRADILMHLVDNALLNIENSRVFIIKVNEAGAGILNKNKEALLARVGQDAQLDIIIDPLMENGSCIIETDGGVFDCSLDTQLVNLVKDLKLLSIRGGL